MKTMKYCEADTLRIASIAMAKENLIKAKTGKGICAVDLHVHDSQQSNQFKAYPNFTDSFFISKYL